jgi:site-specific DNA recombinase
VAPEKPNANTIFLRGVKGAMAEYERAQILERTERGRRGRATAGYPVVQKVPLGYRYEGTAHQGAYVIMPDEAAVVERIFHLYVESRLTMYGIACLLRREGVPTYGDRRVRAYPQERESRWYTTYIQRILTNTAYLGTVYYGKTTRCPSPKAPDKKSAWKVTERDTWIAVPVPPIVSQDLWDAAQRQRQHNAQMSRRNRKSDYLLGGSRLRCEVCGLVMSGTTSRTTRYYRCNQLSPAVAPHCRRLVNADWIEPAVWAEVLRLVEHPDYLRTLIAAQQEEPSILARQAERERLERDARQVAHKLRRWEDAYEDASISLGTFKMKQQPLEAQQTLLTTRLHLLTVEEERDRAWTSEWERLLAWLHGL